MMGVPLSGIAAEFAPKGRLCGGGESTDHWGSPELEMPLPNGLVFRVTSPRMVGAAQCLYKEIFGRQRYFRRGFEIRPNDTVLDIGANMGMFALWAAPQAAQGRVIAVEPMDVIECLDGNMRLNGLGNITPLQAAVGRDGDELEFVDYPGFNIITHQAGLRPTRITRLLIRLLLFRYRAQPVHVRASCVSLGRIIDELGLSMVNYLKIDCEGGEYDIFRTLAPEHWQRIERIAMEFHELQPGQRHEELVSLLKAQGFEVEVRKPWFDYHFMKFGEIWARLPASGANSGGAGRDDKGGRHQE